MGFRNPCQLTSAYGFNPTLFQLCMYMPGSKTLLTICTVGRTRSAILLGTRCVTRMYSLHISCTTVECVGCVHVCVCAWFGESVYQSPYDRYEDYSPLATGILLECQYRISRWLHPTRILPVFNIQGTGISNWNYDWPCIFVLETGLLKVN